MITGSSNRGDPVGATHVESGDNFWDMGECAGSRPAAWVIP